jgi:hypothetical protein
MESPRRDHANNATAGQEYDGLNRLIEFRRGTLDATNASISGGDKGRQVFTLDLMGNWTGVQASATDGGTWDLNR